MWEVLWNLSGEIKEETKARFLDFKVKNVCVGFFSLNNKQLVRLFGSLDSVGIQGACGFSNLLHIIT